MIPRWQEFFVKLWIQFRAGYARRNDPLTITVRTEAADIIRTEQKSQEDCSWCGQKAAVRTQVARVDLPYAVDVWHCRRHAPNWRDYL